MNNIREEEILIEGYKSDFIQNTGKAIKITVCNRWESAANFTSKANFWAIIKLIFDYTGWTWNETFGSTPYKVGSRLIKPTGKRNDEKIFRRGVIDYITVNNGVSLVYVGKEGGDRDHTTVIHSVKKFEERLETEYYTQKAFREIINYVKENYHLYKDRTVLKPEIIGSGSE